MFSIHDNNVAKGQVDFVELPGCTVCFDPYDTEGDKRPKALPCGHALCGACLAVLPKKLCPECRANIPANVPFHVAMIELLQSKFKPPPITKEMVADKIRQLEQEFELVKLSEKEKAERDFLVLTQHCREEVEREKETIRKDNDRITREAERSQEEAKRRKELLIEAQLAAKKAKEEVFRTEAKYEKQIRERDSKEKERFDNFTREINRKEKERFDSFVRGNSQNLLDEVNRFKEMYENKEEQYKALMKKCQDVDQKYCESFQNLVTTNEELKFDVAHCQHGWKQATNETQAAQQESKLKQARIDILECALFIESNDAPNAKPATFDKMYLWNDRFNEYFETSSASVTVYDAIRMLKHKISELNKEGDHYVADDALKRFCNSDNTIFRWGELQRILLGYCIYGK